MIIAAAAATCCFDICRHFADATPCLRFFMIITFAIVVIFRHYAIDIFFAFVAMLFASYAAMPLSRYIRYRNGDFLFAIATYYATLSLPLLRHAMLYYAIHLLLLPMRTDTLMLTP